MDSLFSGALRFADFEALFAPYFGFHPLGLEGLMPDLFDKLARSLEEPVSIPDLPKGDQVSTPETGNPDRSFAEPEWRVTRGYAPEVATSWDNGPDDQVSERPSALLALQMLPMAFTGLIGRVKNGRRK